MSSHYTAHVKITKTVEKVEDGYGKTTQDRQVKDVAEFTVRAAEYTDLVFKIKAITDNAGDDMM